MNSFAMLIACLCCLAAPDTQPAVSVDLAPVVFPFFAMDTATRDFGPPGQPTAEAQLRMAGELGFAGWACNLPEATEATIQLADTLGLKLFAIYTGVDADPGAPGPWDPKLPETIRRLKGHGTAVWVFVTSKKNPASSDAADASAVEAMRRVAAMAAESDLSVSLYPHTGFYVASTRDALRLVRKVDRPNVNVTFNLCHWLKVDRGKDLDGILRGAMPHLGIVTINGADNEGDNWDRLIQPLGRGSFDVYGLLAKLQQLGFKGPVGLQGYGIKGDVHGHLTQAMRTWRDYSRRLALRTGMSDTTYRVQHVPGAAIELDGRADEPAWSQAQVEKYFTFPWKRAAAPETQFRALADDEYLHFTFRVHDADVFVLEKLRDKEDELFEDRVEMYFARDDQLKDYYCLEIDSRGRVFDYHGSYYRHLDPKWNWAGVEAKASALARGYVVEGRIPLASFETLGLPRLRPGAKARCGLYRAEFSHDRSGRPVEQRDSIHNLGRRIDGPPPIEEWVSWIDPKMPEPDFHVPSSFGWLEVVR